MGHLFGDVNHPYPLCLVVGVRLQQLSRSRAETETRYLAADVAFHRFGGGCWRALGGATEGHVAKRAAAALDTVCFGTRATGRRGSRGGVGNV